MPLPLHKYEIWIKSALGDDIITERWGLFGFGKCVRLRLFNVKAHLVSISRAIWIILFSFVPTSELKVHIDWKKRKKNKKDWTCAWVGETVFFKGRFWLGLLRLHGGTQVILKQHKIFVNV